MNYNSPTSASTRFLTRQSGCLLRTAQPTQVDGEVVGRAEGEGVIGAEHPTVGVEGGSVQIVGLLVPAQGGQVEGQAGSRTQGVGVIGAEHPTVGVEGG